jgi:hypothetical protein
MHLWLSIMSSMLGAGVRAQSSLLCVYPLSQMRLRGRARDALAPKIYRRIVLCVLNYVVKYGQLLVCQIYG